jgi:hypothetical protein
MTPEGRVKKDVAISLASLELAGDVVWHERLNSGSIHSEGIHINGCRPGTYDFLCLFTGKDRGLCGAFIECKRDDRKAVLSDTQKAFKAKYDGKHPHVFFWLVQSGREVKRLILDHCYSRLNDVEM